MASRPWRPESGFHRLHNLIGLGFVAQLLIFGPGLIAEGRLPFFTGNRDHPAPSGPLVQERRNVVHQITRRACSNEVPSADFKRDQVHVVPQLVQNHLAPIAE